MPEILINVVNKIPQLTGDVRQITSGNGDYTARLVFDDDWADGEKTVLFVRENGFAYPAVRTENDCCAVPEVNGVPLREWLYIGVKQGDVYTSRPCGIAVYRSIDDMISDEAVQPDPSLWEDILARLIAVEENVDEVVSEAVEEYLRKNPIGVPTKVSELENDTGFITRLVNDLANYYRKGETYTREEVDGKISAIPKFSIAVVDALPTENISGTAVYLVRSGDDSGDLYTEYIFAGGAWEILGSQRVDLTGYVTDGQLKDALKDYAKVSDIPEPDVFWAQYGVTSYADIRAAVDAGKLCVLRSNNDTAVLASGEFAEFFDFLGDRYQNTRVLYRLRPDDSWITQNYSIITEYDRTSAITPDSAGRMIPTDKAVYDAILKYATGGTGTDLYGSAMVTITGPDYDNLAVESIMFPPGVTEAADQNKLLAACAVKCFLTVAASEDDLTMGFLDCGECMIDEESGSVSLSFAGTVVGGDAVTLLLVTTDLESVTAIPQIVSQSGGNGGGSCESGWTEILPETTAVIDDPEAVFAVFPPIDVSVGDVCRVYYQGDNYSADAVVTAVEGEFAGEPTLILSNINPDEVNGSGFVIYAASGLGTIAGDRRGSASITLRIEKRGDCVGWEDFDALAEKVDGKLDASALTDAVNDALAQAKESGEFNGEPGDDYVLTDDDKTEIAQEAAGLIDTALLSIIGEVSA